MVESKSDDGVCAYLALKYDTSSKQYHCEAYADTIRRIEGVKWCHAISGETDMMLYLDVPNMHRLNEIRAEVQAIPDIKQVVTHIVLTEFFNTSK